MIHCSHAETSYLKAGNWGVCVRVRVGGGARVWGVLREEKKEGETDPCGREETERVSDRPT